MSATSEKISKFEYSAVKKYLYIKWLRSNEIYDYVVNTVHGACSSYVTVRSWMENFPSTMTRGLKDLFLLAPENIVVVHDMILRDRLI